MSDVAVSNRVVARNDMGRFIQDCDQAATATARKMVVRGAKLSREMAPRGEKSDPRTTTLRDSIEPKMVSATAGVWTATARHALAQELGAAPHEISAWVAFFWEKAGRPWMVPSAYQRVTGYPGADPIHHPGNAPQPYLRPAYEIVMNEAMSIARGEYPG